MKKLILVALIWPAMQFFRPVYAQKEKTKTTENGREIIILKNGDKDKKITIETKDGETYINGKKASEYKDDDVTIVSGKNRGNFIYAPNGGMTLFNEGGEKKAFLGVTTEKDDKGAKVMDVEKGSAADKAGLKEGDIITAVGSKKISDASDLTDAISSYKPKDEVKIYFDRNGKSDNVKATLGERSGLFRSFAYTAPTFKRNQELLKSYNWDFSKKTPLKIQAAPFNFNYNWGVGNMGGRRLGMKIEDTDDGGAKVTNVEEGSAAEKAGLKKDDIITEVNGKKVKDVNEVVEQLRNGDKDSYNLKAKRNGSDMSFDVKIPKRKNKADL